MIESNGNYTFAYSDRSKVYIVRTDSDMSPTDTISVSKRLPLVGGVTCDCDGNYYVCYGYVDESGKGDTVTVDIAKYDHSGNYIASYEYIPNTRDTGDYNEYLTYKGGWATKEPFGAGNCCMTIRNGVLICFMGRGMYNGHQSSAVYAVNTSNMTQNTSYFTYSSHSFNQRILAASDGTVLFADHGDAYPRGFKLSKNADTEIVPFHINGNTGNNDTYAELGGIGEVSSGYVLIGSSIKSDDKKSGKQLFMQVVSKDLSRVVSSGTSHSVKIDGRSVSDSGVIWLTDNSNYSIRNIITYVMNNDEILIMYERFDSENKYSDSFYEIVDPNGKVTQKPLSLGGVRTNGREELKYSNGYVYWTTAFGEKIAQIHKMKVGKSISISSVPNHAYNGTAKKPDVVIKDGSKTLTLGSDYKLSYDNNTELGKAAIKITGKNDYANWSMSAYFNIVLGTPKLTASKVSNTKMTLKWSSVKCPKRYIWETRSYSTSPTSYTIYISANDGVYKKAGTVSGSKTSCTLKKFDLKNNSYKVKIRAYFDGKETYSSIDYDWDSNKWIYPQFYSAYSNVVSVK